MHSKLSPIILIVLIFTVGLLAYFLGKKNGTKTFEHVATNYTFIQEIAELSSLEAQGIASIKTTNIANDGSITDEFKKMFLEKTVNIAIPYVAKYGIDVEKQTISVQEKDTLVTVVLPNPKLLSFELRMDKADAITKRGLFESADDNYYHTIEKKLYTQSRSQLENNEQYLQQSKDKIAKIIQSYYAPLKVKVDVVFKDELKSKVITRERN